MFKKNKTIKKCAFILLGSIFVFVSCNNDTKNKEVDLTSKEVKSTADNSIYNGPIIDMHIHAYHQKTPTFGMPLKQPLTGKTYASSVSLEKHKEETFDAFKRNNIVKAVVSRPLVDWREPDPSSGDWYQQDSSLVVIGKDHFFPTEELRKLHAKGKLHVLGEVAPNYAGLLPTDESMVEYFDLAVELDIPVGFHMFPGGPPGAPYTCCSKVRAHQGKPLQLEEILISRPNMRIYIMHAAWPYLEDMKALMYAHPQVYVDLGAISWAVPQKEFHSYLQGLVEAGYGKRIMFGSDQMEWVATIDDAIENVNSASFLTMEQKEDIFYNNAARFLKLPKEEIETHKKTN